MIKRFHGDGRNYYPISESLSEKTDLPARTQCSPPHTLHTAHTLYDALCAANAMHNTLNDNNSSKHCKHCHHFD